MANFEVSTTIPEFFKGKNILLTGGTGFIGKCLIEKLLRCCPQVGTIYLLMRAKKGVAAEDRIRTITDSPVSFNNRIANFPFDILLNFVKKDTLTSIPFLDV